ncbi:PLDc N-terminal domain-containing protein [Nocardia stercoris]|nr:PLDc N-terminal domain-containing protein [Nocardia stercoris]
MSNVSLAALIPVLVLEVAFVAYCWTSIYRVRATKFLPKAVWALLVLLVMPIGGIVYLVCGRDDAVER